MNLLVITSFNKPLWEAYARSSLKSWVKHLKVTAPQELQLLVTVDGEVPEDLMETLKDFPGKVTVELLDNHKEYREYIKKYKNYSPPNPQAIPKEHQFRYQHLRFWPKVFTMFMASDYEDTAILWLDADVSLHKDLPIEKIVADLEPKGHMPGKSFVCLGRGKKWGYMDSGYFLSDNQNQRIVNNYNRFVGSLYNLYQNGVIFKFQEWHDAYLITHLLDILFTKEHKALEVLSLSGESESLNPMEDTWLSEYMIHFKGNRKASLSVSSQT